MARLGECRRGAGTGLQLFGRCAHCDFAAGQGVRRTPPFGLASLSHLPDREQRSTSWPSSACGRRRWPVGHGDTPRGIVTRMGSGRTNGSEPEQSPVPEGRAQTIRPLRCCQPSGDFAIALRRGRVRGLPAADGDAARGVSIAQGGCDAQKRSAVARIDDPRMTEMARSAYARNAAQAEAAMRLSARIDLAQALRAHGKLRAQPLDFGPAGAQLPAMSLADARQ